MHEIHHSSEIVFYNTGLTVYYPSLSSTQIDEEFRAFLAKLTQNTHCEVKVSTVSEYNLFYIIAEIPDCPFLLYCPRALDPELSETFYQQSCELMYRVIYETAQHWQKNMLEITSSDVLYLI